MLKTLKRFYAYISKPSIPTPRVYTEYACEECEKVIKFLEENEIEFEERNIETDVKYLNEARSTGYYKTPVITSMNGLITGYDEARMLLVLKNK